MALVSKWSAVCALNAKLWNVVSARQSAFQIFGWISGLIVVANCFAQRAGNRTCITCHLMSVACPALLPLWRPCCRLVLRTFSSHLLSRQRLGYLYNRLRSGFRTVQDRPPGLDPSTSRVHLIHRPQEMPPSEEEFVRTFHLSETLERHRNQRIPPTGIQAVSTRPMPPLQAQLYYCHLC